ncbi:MAG TPA: hypothetical protein PLB01_19330, partial [Thermoanaerobaculia bacterium]|nr:hypothetical protein [Thermoanaerobaculia bacterium]
VPAWLPPGARAAVCFSVDDVHPAGTEPGGEPDLARRALDVVAWLQDRHPRLAVTFFTTPDWRSASPAPEPGVVGRIPILGKFVYQARVLPRNTCRLSRHPAFCSTLRSWPRSEIALHGLHHVRRGPSTVAEFEGLGPAACRALLARAQVLFDEAGLPCVRGLCPPGWLATPALLRAMDEIGMAFLASARDLESPVSPEGVTRGSGLTGVPLFRPARLPGTRLVHLSTNFQATSSLDRARAIVETGGLLSIKAHLLQGLGRYRALDGLGKDYAEHLHRVLSTLEDEHGDALWWPRMSAIADRVRADANAEACA